jgi:hypothetical protein
MSSLKAKKSSRTKRVEAAARAAPAAVVIGSFTGLAMDGAPLVDFPDNPAGGPVRALATASYDMVAPGAAVALMFMNGDPAQPLVIGLVSPPGSLAVPATELVLQCGRASIVLTSAGKVLIRGTYVSSRSSGMQRITGASVQIN